MNFVFQKLVSLVVLLWLCFGHGVSQDLSGTWQLPRNKVWAHRVNDIATAQAKENAFGGMEVDIIYSQFQNQLLVCHDTQDTLNGLTLEQWFAALQNPSEHGYWLDVKDLNYQSADTVSSMIRDILTRYNVVNLAFVESWDPWVLQKVKRHHLHTSLWVDSFQWSDLDTTAWVAKVNQLADIAQPDALSCEFGMFGALTEFFPQKNIFLWHTPAKLNLENVKLTLKLCQHPSVKIVLVDYNPPKKTMKP